MSTGILFMAYGSPGSLDEVGAYYAHIRGGRAPSAEQIAELRARYVAIGGRSPLPEFTQRQAAGVQQLLADAGVPVRAYVGMKHAGPFIADTVARMAADGIRAAVGIALAPHYSRLSVATYLTTAEEAAARHGLRLRVVPSWHDHPGFITSLAARLREAHSQTSGPRVPVVFTAHSLPARIQTWDDPYPRQLQQTCDLVAAAAGVVRWRFAYQSASRTGEPWLGPDLLDVLRDLRASGETECVVCPVGFVADHLEVLYDIDVEAQAASRALGLRLVRTRSLNADADFLAALADLVRANLPQEVTR